MILRRILLTAIPALLAACASHDAPKDAARASTADQIGLGLLAENKGPESLALFEQAMALDSTQPEYQMHSGLSYVLLERFDEAEKRVGAACARVEIFPACWSHLADVQLRAGHPALAAKSARRALSVDTFPSPEIALAHLARAELALGRPNEALAAVEKALRLSPRSCDLRPLATLIRSRRGEFEAALDEAQRAVTFCPHDPRGHFWIAFSEYKLGRRDRAQKKYREIMDLFKQPEIVDKSRAAVERLQKRLPLDEPTKP